MEERLYVLVNPRSYKPMVICKIVEIENYNEELARFKISEVIYDNSGNGIYRYYNIIGAKVVGSKQYIYDIK